ncbi:hypothetical protein JR338_12625 (plasmid) [Chloroflexota bacterium]|nr:hypothetical protein JR338_12625 [Chloroflexota bacterium]
MVRKATLLTVILMTFLVGCTAATQTEVAETATSTEAPALSTQPQLTILPTLTIQERVTLTPGTGGALTIEEHPLTQREDIDVVWAEYEDAEWTEPQSVPHRVTIGDDVYSFKEEHILLNTDPDGMTEYQVDVRLYKNDELFMTITLGDNGPLPAVWGFVATEDSWYLEINRGERIDRGDGSIEATNLGDIIKNGESLNELEGYQQSFGFHILSGKPFYFFIRDDALGYSYDGVEYPLDYDRISNHACCSSGLANPHGLEDRMVFFANRGDQRYLVIVGDF